MQLLHLCVFQLVSTCLGLLESNSPQSCPHSKRVPCLGSGEACSEIGGRRKSTGAFPKPFWRPYNKDDRILGSRCGPPFMEAPKCDILRIGSCLAESMSDRRESVAGAKFARESERERGESFWY